MQVKEGTNSRLKFAALLVILWDNWQVEQPVIGKTLQGEAATGTIGMVAIGIPTHYSRQAYKRKKKEMYGLHVIT